MTDEIRLPSEIVNTVRTLADAVEAAEKRNLATMPYQEYLETDHWKRIRDAALVRARYRCQVCDGDGSQSAGGPLEVHHRTYQRRGQELDHDVTVLCQTCHDIFHANRRIR